MVGIVRTKGRNLVSAFNASSAVSGSLIALAVVAGGTGWAINDTFTVPGGTSGVGKVSAITTYTTAIDGVAQTTNIQDITIANILTKTFTISAPSQGTLYGELLQAGFQFSIVGSIANNGTYTIVSASVVDTNTFSVVVSQSIPSAIADGTANLPGLLYFQSEHVAVNFPPNGTLTISGSASGTNDGTKAYQSAVDFVLSAVNITVIALNLGVPLTNAASPYGNASNTTVAETLSVSVAGTGYTSASSVDVTAVSPSVGAGLVVNTTAA